MHRPDPTCPFLSGLKHNAVPADQTQRPAPSARLLWALLPHPRVSVLFWCEYSCRRRGLGMGSVY